MYILIYVNCTEEVWGMHVRWNYPPCIQRCNKECLPFNTTLVLRGFIPGFSATIWHWLGHEGGLCLTPENTDTALKADPLKGGQHEVGRIPHAFSRSMKENPSF